MTWVPCGGRIFFFERLDRNGSISLNFILCNHFSASSVCCYVIITELARYNEKHIDDGGYPVVGGFFFFKRLDRKGSISLKFMVCNHFAAFSVCCYVITELTRYKKKNDVGTLWWANFFL